MCLQLLGCLLTKELQHHKPMRPMLDCYDSTDSCRKAHCQTSRCTVVHLAHNTTVCRVAAAYEWQASTSGFVCSAQEPSPARLYAAGRPSSPFPKGRRGTCRGERGPEKLVPFSGEGSGSSADAMSAMSRQRDDIEVPCRDNVRVSSAPRNCKSAHHPPFSSGHADAETVFLNVYAMMQKPSGYDGAHQLHMAFPVRHMYTPPRERAG